jgi:ribosome maturation factor RimP
MPGGSRSAVGPVTGGRRPEGRPPVPPGGLPDGTAKISDKRLAELIEPVVGAAGMDLESVRMSVAGRRRLLRIVVDGDHGVSLDDAADVSREISAMLDGANVLGEVPYTLEVSSPGVDRPLTEPRHWRRAVGRLVKVKVAGEPAVEGRILAADADGVTLDLAQGERRFELGELGAGAIQIEFGRIPDAELDQSDDEDEDPDLADEDDGDEDDEDDEDLGAGGDGH